MVKRRPRKSSEAQSEQGLSKAQGLSEELSKLWRHVLENTYFPTPHWNVILPFAPF
jgi:hypothetical protein